MEAVGAGPRQGSDAIVDRATGGLSSSISASAVEFYPRGEVTGRIELERQAFLPLREKIGGVAFDGWGVRLGEVDELDFGMGTSR